MTKINVLVFFVLVGFTSGIILDAFEKFQTPWNNVYLEEKFKNLESSDDSCVNGEENCSRNLSALKNNLRELNDMHLLRTDKRGRSHLVDLGNFFSCSCGMDIHLIDLGEYYFPQYVLSGKCQPTCRAGSQKCRPKYYPLVVLKMKNPENSESIGSANTIHPKLKDAWIAEKLKIIVSCECGS